MAEFFKLTVKRGVARRGFLNSNVVVRLTVDGIDKGEVQSVPTIDLAAPREWIIQFDAGATFLEISVSAPLDRNLWTSSGSFKHKGGGTIETLAAPNFENQALILERSPSGGAVHMVTAHLFRVRDVTDRVMAALGLSSWGVNVLDPFRFVDPGWAPPPSPTFGSVTGNSNNDNLVLEVANINTPQLIAVSWPPGIQSTASDVPVCAFIHPTLIQARDDFDVPYPMHTNYLGVLSRYTQYFDPGDPLGASHPKGLPLQIAAARRNAVLVLPLGRLFGTPSELGEFVTSPGYANLISEILQFMAMRKGNASSPPAMGRMALAAFSSGHDLFNVFLDNHAGTDLYKTNLSELYCFDPMADIGAKTVRIVEVVTRINRWRSIKKAQPSATGNNADRVVRIYDQSGGPVPVDGGSWAAGGGDFTTLALLPPSAWSAVLGRTPHRMEVHQIIPATMMTHAMRTSGFAGRSLP